MATVTIKRANVLLTIPEEQIDEYLSKGFDVINEKGEVIKRTTATNDVHTLMKQLEAANKTIKKLEEKIEMLEQEIEEGEDEAPKGLVDPEPKEKKKPSKK